MVVRCRLKILSWGCYHKFPEYSDTQKICFNHSKIWTMWLYHRVMSPNDADRMANSVDPDRAVWSGTALFAQEYLSENLGSLRYSYSCVACHVILKVNRSDGISNMGSNMIFYALTSAGSLSGSGFNTSRGAQQRLMYQKSMFGLLLLHKNILWLENFGENAARSFFFPVTMMARKSMLSVNVLKMPTRTKANVILTSWNKVCYCACYWW